MTLVGFLLLLLVAVICGFLVQVIVGYSHGGWLVSVFLGLIGAYLGVWLARQAGLGSVLTIRVGGYSFPIVWSIIGAGLFIVVLSPFTSRRGE